MYKSIKTLLFSEFIALAIAPLLLATVIVFWLDYSSFIKSEKQSQDDMSKRFVIQLSSFFTEVQCHMESANRYQRIMTLPREEQHQILSIILTKRSLYRNVLLVDGHGQDVLFLSNSGEKMSEMHNGLSDAMVSLLSASPPSYYHSKVRFDESNGEPLMTMAIPLINLKDNSTEGILFATVLLKSVWEMIGNVTLQDGADLYILDSNNQLVAHRNPSLVLRKTTINFDSESVIQRGIDGRKSIVSIRTMHLDGQSFKVVAERSLSYVFATLLNSLLLIALLFVLALAGAICLAILTYRQILRPIETVSTAVQEIKDGNLEKRLTLHREDEIGALAQSVNAMTQQLQKSHEELEIKVQERTTELASANKSLQKNINERLQVEQDLQQKQNFLNAVLENIEDGVVVCDEKGVLSLFNRASRDFHGLSEESLSSEKWAEHYGLYSADGKTIMEREDIPLFRAFQGDHIQDVEMVIIQKQGKKYVLLASGQPFYDPQGKKLGAVISMHDVTEKKHADELLKKAHQELETKVKERTAELKKSYEQLAKEVAEREEMAGQLRQSQKMEAIGTLAGGIAHDFNNILSAIIGYAEIAKEDLTESSQSVKDIDKVIVAGKRATELVKQILTFSRKTDQHKITLRVDLIANEALKLLRSSLPTTIDIHTSIEKETGLVLADPTSIHQIVVNLCTNASQAIGNEKGKMEVILKRTNLDPGQVVDKPRVQAGPFLQLTVKDTGMGIDEQTVTRIFEPYFTTKKQGEGTGLGLAVIHGIVEDCNGFIEVESTLGKGTAFHVFLPIVKEEQTVITDKKNKSQISTGNENIFIIDDEPAIANIGQAMLTRLGYTVTTEIESLEALKKFEKNPDAFDLVITDQTMPDLTGCELAQAMLTLRPDLPIIICSGYSSVVSKDKAYALGIKKFIAKPFSKEELGETVRCVLDESEESTV